MAGRRLLLLLISALALASCGPMGARKAPPPAQDQYYSAERPLPMPTEAAQQSPAPKPGTPKMPEMEGDILIGMLAPLSGPQAAIGQQLRDAALMGLYDKQKTLSRVQMTRNPQLIIRDSGTNPKQLKQATLELLDAGAQVILGPLMAEDVRVAGKITTERQVPLIAFSNNEDVARPGVYVFGFNPAQQIRRVADYALRQQVQHYAALAPQNDYGRKVVQDLSSQVSAKGFSLQPVEFFTDGEMPQPEALTRVIRTVADWGEKRKAILLPMTGKPLAKTTYEIMATKNIRPEYIKLLGTGLWDDPEITAIPALQGAWFATSDPKQTLRFAEKFQTTYGKEPARLASLAYDAVALVTTLALENGATAFLPETMTDREGFAGPANGIFRLLPDGKVERALAVVEIGNGSFRIIEPAPSRFR